jgi:hypothetical protein
VGTQVVAHPLDTTVDQGADHKMAQLGHFLEAGAGLWKDIDEADQKEGKEDALMGKEMKQTALGSYERGWLHVRGTLAGAEDSSKLQADFDSGKAQADATGGIEGWLKQQAAGHTQGMLDGPYADAYKAKLAEGMNAIRSTHFTKQRESLVAQGEADTINLLSGMLQGKTKDGVGVTADDYQGLRNTLKDQGIEYDDKRWSELGHKALQAAAIFGNVQAIDAAQAQAKDGSKSFGQLTDADFFQLRHYAQAVLIQNAHQEREALKFDYEKRVNDAMYPVMKMAMTDQAKAQMMFNQLALQGDVFKSHPEDLQKYQQMLVQTGDRALTLDERESENHLMEEIWKGKAQPQDIFAAKLPSKSTLNLMTVYMDKWKVERAAQAQERQAAAMTGLFKNQEVVQDIRSSLESLPKFPTDRYDSAVLNDVGGVYSNKVREIAAQTHTDLFRAANDAGGDVEAFSKKRTAIIEQARAHIGRVLNDAAGGVKGGAVTVPAFIQYPTWAAYVAAASRGEVPKDPELLKRTREWYESTGKMK